MEYTADSLSSAQIRENNLQLVRRYFREIVDGRSVATLEEIFHPDCRIVRADRADPLRGNEALRRFFRMSIAAVPSIQTSFHSLVCDDHNCVAAHISHTARFGRVVITPMGLCFAEGRSATWQAMAMFRIEGDRILEEFVIRDEMSILRQLGMISPARPIFASLRNLARRIFGASNRQTKTARDTKWKNPAS